MYVALFIAVPSSRRLAILSRSRQQLCSQSIPSAARRLLQRQVAAASVWRTHIPSLFRSVGGSRNGERRDEQRPATGSEAAAARWKEGDGLENTTTNFELLLPDRTGRTSPQ